MSRYFTTVTRKGQITIPAEIRRALSINEGDKVLVAFDDGQVRLERYGGVAERTAGMLREYAVFPVPTDEEVSEFFEQGVADEVARDMEERC